MFKPTIKHTLWNLKEACLGAIPVFLTAVGILYAKECHEDKAIDIAYENRMKDFLEEAEDNPNKECSEEE